ncbi:hypothetical protein PCANC_10446 [Puccinia coronata f. sp. avenae]|uniref:Uncharacterized protein n=1 Tax=Puccinia coronata f. sp. avenae TaxID=200324 RepID=A0A2N5VI86_9BASI|nr:hypothetical protein PCANC_10446 [Puccinia coronata f. sp. avenae]
MIPSTSTSSNNHGSDHQKLITFINTGPPQPVFHIVAPKATDINQTRLKKEGHKTSVNHFKAIKWWDKEILDPLVKIRNKSSCLLIMHPMPDNAERYNYWNKIFREKVATLKQQHWRSFLVSTDSTSVFQAFQFTKPCIGGGILPLRGPDGTITSNKEEQAKLLLEGTSVVRSKCDLDNIPPINDSSFVVYPAISRQEVLGVLGRLARKKASGLDRIPNEVLSICAPDGHNRNHPSSTNPTTHPRGLINL